MPSRARFRVVVMLLGVAACGGGAAAPAAPIDIAVTPARDAGLAPASSSAAPSATSMARPSGGAAEASACAAPCNGRPGADLVDALSRRAKQAHRCYDQALAVTPTLHGRVLVHMVIGADGRSCSARADAPNDPDMLPVAECVAGFYRSSAGEARLPPPGGGCADITLPINFVHSPDGGAP